MVAGSYGNATFDRNLAKGAKGLQAGRRYHKDGALVRRVSMAVIATTGLCTSLSISSTPKARGAILRRGFFMDACATDSLGW